MLLSSFMQNRRGAVAPMFALAIIPILGLVGAAIDYSRANSVRAGMQAALDATALAMAKLAPTLTASELQTKTNAYFQAMFSHPEAKEIVITPSYTTQGGSQLTIAVSGSVDTTFMNVLGFSKMSLGSSSTVKWGNSRLRVALALDNTGSMASAGKMEALKTAAKALLTQLKTAATTNGDVYVSIIPFSKDVNVGKSNYNQYWVDFGDHGDYEGWDALNGDDVSSTTCTKKGKKTKCTTSNTWVPDNHNTWNGCVTDRDKENDVDNTAPVAGKSKTLFPAEQYDDCPVQMMGLSYDWNALNAKVDAMYPAGNTNQTIGLQWGFQSLTAAPFTIPAKDPNYKYSDVIILLTDGLNTENRYDTDQDKIDQRTAKACDNINKADITLYTIQVNTGGDPVSTLLKNCAGTAPSANAARKYPDPDKNFVVTSSTGIGTVFNQIGTNLSQLRIAK